MAVTLTVIRAPPIRAVPGSAPISMAHIRVPRLARLRGRHARVDGMSRLRVGSVDGASASRVSRRSRVRSRGAEVGSRVVGPCG